MKKRIINVIEVIDNSVSSVESFIIEHEINEQEIVQRAEALFIEKAKENGVGESAVEDVLEDAYFAQGNYYLCITWSNVN